MGALLQQLKPADYIAAASVIVALAAIGVTTTLFFMERRDRKKADAALADEQRLSRIAAEDAAKAFAEVERRRPAELFHAWLEQLEDGTFRIGYSNPSPSPVSRVHVQVERCAHGPHDGVTQPDWHYLDEWGGIGTVPPTGATPLYRPWTGHISVRPLRPNNPLTDDEAAEYVRTPISDGWRTLSYEVVSVSFKDARGQGWKRDEDGLREVIF